MNSPDEQAIALVPLRRQEKLTFIHPIQHQPFNGQHQNYMEQSGERTENALERRCKNSDCLPPRNDAFGHVNEYGIHSNYHEWERPSSQAAYFDKPEKHQEH